MHKLLAALAAATALALAPAGVALADHSGEEFGDNHPRACENTMQLRGASDCVFVPGETRVIFPRLRR